MLDALKNWFSSAPAPRKGWDALAPWAKSRTFAFRGVRKSEGFVVDGRLGATAWRLEWGPSQRDYVSGFELRLRSELSLPPDLQLLVLNRELQESMEKAVFDQYVEGVQTRIDSNTPPEMRWLVMFPKLSGSELGTLRDRYAAIASHKTWLTRWLAGPVSDELASAPAAAGDPLTLMISRGRLMLRTNLTEPDVDVLERWLVLFEAAMRAAQRVAAETGDGTAPSTQPSLWNTSAMPADAPRPE